MFASTFALMRFFFGRTEHFSVVSQLTTLIELTNPQNLIGWKDPSHHYDFHNLMFDVPMEGMREKYSDPVPMGDSADTNGSNTTNRRPIFSTIKHYPPKWMKDDLMR